jgi:hypothetical protein
VLQQGFHTSPVVIKTRVPKHYQIMDDDDSSDWEALSATETDVDSVLDDKEYKDDKPLTENVTTTEDVNISNEVNNEQPNKKFDYTALAMSLLVKGNETFDC